MCLSQLYLARREAVAAFGRDCCPAPRFLPPCRPPATDAEASALLDSIGDNLLRLSPESATSLGVDTGARAALRSRLADRSVAGQQHLAALLQRRFGARRSPRTIRALSFPVRTSVEVVRSAYTTALEGFAQPYGDVAVGGWRNTPYVVIQNVGAYLDVPRFLDAEHPIETRADAEAYLARLQSYPKQLDGELERMKSARAAGLVPPDFLLDKAITAMEATRQGRRERWSARRIDRTPHESEGHSRRLGGPARARSRSSRCSPRSSASSPSSRPSAPSPKANPACGRARTAMTITAGRSRPRRPRR